MNTEEVDMAYFFLGQSTRTICNRLRKVDAGMNKFFSHLQAKAPNTNAEAALIMRMHDKLQILQITKKKLINANTCFQRALESRMGFFKSFIPGTEENRMRKDISASIPLIEKRISQLTHEIQNFTNVGFKAKL